MDKRTVSSAHQRIDEMQLQIVELRTEAKIQFKDIFNRVKRLEAVLIATSGATIVMLLTILTRMG
jgi:hypothetical protein|tara:strand:+ start:1326 stop:1520 length:195 start_codon:yes stop_codon:yes gene_type:complete